MQNCPCSEQAQANPGLGLLYSDQFLYGSRRMIHYWFSTRISEWSVCSPSNRTKLPTSVLGVLPSGNPCSFLFARSSYFSLVYFLVTLSLLCAINNLERISAPTINWLIMASIIGNCGDETPPKIPACLFKSPYYPNTPTHCPRVPIATCYWGWIYEAV